MMLEAPSNTLPRLAKRLEYESLQEPRKLPAKSIFALSNISVPISYLLVGLGDFLLTPLSVYMVNTMDAEPWQQTTISVITMLPWSFKIVYGFWSDIFPVGGLHRKPYLILGYLLQCYCYLYLAYISFTTHSIAFESLALLLFLQTFGTIMADVMADTLVVEHSSHTERESERGQTQATCYAIRFFGSILGNLGGTVLFNQDSWGWGLSFWQVNLILGLLPMILLFPTAFFMYETPDKALRPVRQQIKDIWDMCQQQAVWRPMLFVYLYSVFQVPCAAWSSFLQLGLNFEPWEIGMLCTIGALMTFVGILAYKKFFFKSSWRSIYITTTLLVCAFSTLQLMLVLRWNVRYFKISDFFFSMGDDVLASYVSGVQFLPVCIMYIQLCPEGSEGATYAMLTTYGNMAGTLASALGTVLAGVWDVSNDAMLLHQYSGLFKLTLLTSLLCPIPLLLIWLLPATAEETRQLRDSTKKSVLGGAVFLLVLFASLLYTVWDAVSAMLF